jgi:hypothetical protein
MGVSAMAVKLHPHAVQRLEERGVLSEEVTETVTRGERFSAKFGRTGFRRNIAFNADWRGKHYSTKQVEVIAVEDEGDWIVITAIARYF